MSKRRPKKKVATKASKSATRERIVQFGGYDWGWPVLTLATANPELSNRLRSGGFGGCGYGLLSPNGPPFISLLGRNLAGMKTALSLMKEWTTVVGPNAINLEILFDGQGYGLTISQNPELLRYRLMGLNTADRPVVLTMAVIKRLDTRHPFLDELAEYSEQPIAPVLLTVAGITPSNRSPIAASQPWLEGAIRLPGIKVYRRPEDRPPGSMSMLESEIAARSKYDRPPAEATDVATLRSERERLLHSTFPRTIHTLRHRLLGHELLREAVALGCANWQVEQAICNLVLSEAVPEKFRDLKRLNEFERMRRDYVENFLFNSSDITAFNASQVVDQVSLDAGYLLERLDPGSTPPEGVTARNARLAELGYV
jgi:hypothetical protein